MLLHRFIRSTTIRRNFIGCRPTRCLPTSQLLSFCQVCQNRVSQSRGSLQGSWSYPGESASLICRFGLPGVIGTVATAALAAVATTQEVAGGENDGGSFAVVVFAFHQ